MKNLPIDEFSRFHYTGLNRTLVKYATMLLILTLLSLLLEELTLSLLGMAIFILLINFIEMEDIQDVKVSISRHVIKDQFVPNESVPMVIKITNESSRKIHRLEIEDFLPKKLNVLKGSNYLTCNLDPFETIYLTYTIQFPERGTYRVGPIRVQVTDKTGMAIKRWYESSLVQTLYVVPKLIPIRRIPFKLKNLRLFGSTFISRTIGHDEDFRGVREYQKGDPMKFINWKKTAKSPLGTIYVNEYSMNMGLEVYLILDLTRSTEPILEINIESLISLYDFFLRHRARVGHVLVGETVTFSRARRSKQHFQKLARELATVESQSYNNPNVLKKRLITQVSRTSENAFIILISPLLDQMILETLVQISQLRETHVIWSYSINHERQLAVRNQESFLALLLYHNFTSELFSYRQQVVQRILLDNNISFFFWDVRIPFHRAIEQRMR